MIFSQLLKASALGAVIIITVAPKLRDYYSITNRISERMEAVTSGFLTREGFSTIQIEHLALFEISATRDNCHLKIRETPSGGFETDALSANAPSGSKLRYEYDGVLWDTHPSFRATVREMWNRTVWQLHLGNKWAPVLSIVASGTCDLNLLDWQPLARVSAG